MHDEFKIEAGVSVQCWSCGKRTNVLALKMEPGVQCGYCGEVLRLCDGDYAAKSVLVSIAMRRDDVKVD